MGKHCSQFSCAHSCHHSRFSTRHGSSSIVALAAHLWNGNIQPQQHISDNTVNNLSCSRRHFIQSNELFLDFKLFANPHEANHNLLYVWQVCRFISHDQGRIKGGFVVFEWTPLSTDSFHLLVVCYSQQCFIESASCNSIQSVRSEIVFEGGAIWSLR